MGFNAKTRQIDKLREKEERERLANKSALEPDEKCKKPIQFDVYWKLYIPNMICYLVYSFIMVRIRI